MNKARLSAPQLLPRFWLTLAMLAQFSLTFCYLLTLRYELKTSSSDGAVFAQILHNILAGNGPLVSIGTPYVEQHYFGVHFSPALYLLTPLFALFPHVETLLFVQSFGLMLAAWPVFLAARGILGDEWKALTPALLYLSSPWVLNAGLWDFHEIALAAPCIAFMLWAVVERKRRLLLALGLFLLCVKEHYGVSLAGFGALWAVRWREPRFGLLLAGMGLAALALVLFVIMPHYSLLGGAVMLQEGSTIDRYSWLRHPFADMDMLRGLIESNIVYLITLLVSFLLLPLAAPLWLLPGLSDVLANALSAKFFMRSLFSYHNAALLPVLVVAATSAVQRLFAGRRLIKRDDALFSLLLLGLLFTYTQAMLPLTEAANMFETGAPIVARPPADRAALAVVQSRLSANAAVAAQDNVLPHLPPRRRLLHFPQAYEKADALLLNLNFPFARRLTMWDAPYGIPPERYAEAVEAVLDDSAWRAAFFQDGWFLLTRSGENDLAARSAARGALKSLQKHWLDIRAEEK